jgi:hypothetical protein
MLLFQPLLKGPFVQVNRTAASLSIFFGYEEHLITTNTVAGKQDPALLEQLLQGCNLVGHVVLVSVRTLSGHVFVLGTKHPSRKYMGGGKERRRLHALGEENFEIRRDDYHTETTFNNRDQWYIDMITLLISS